MNFEQENNAIFEKCMEILVYFTLCKENATTADVEIGKVGKVGHQLIPKAIDEFLRFSKEWNWVSKHVLENSSKQHFKNFKS